MSSSVSTAENVRPPITVSANGAPMAPAYSLSPMAIGISVTMVVIVVMQIGLRRENPLVMIALIRP